MVPIEDLAGSFLKSKGDCISNILVQQFYGSTCQMIVYTPKANKLKDFYDLNDHSFVYSGTKQLSNCLLDHYL